MTAAPTKGAAAQQIENAKPDCSADRARPQAVAPRCSLCGNIAGWCDCYASVLSAIDDFGADYPLEALRSFAAWLKPWRLDACAICEPAAALLYADHLLTPQRRAYCTEAAKAAGLDRFIPDHLERERREAIRKRLEGLR
jgi:hypothetical protein